VVVLIKLMQSKRLGAGDLKNAKENKLNSFSNGTCPSFWSIDQRRV
jgi:hypothetical protein